jgi:hypothetical protein
MSPQMAQKVIVPQKKIMSRSFLNSGTLIVNLTNHTASFSPPLVPKYILWNFFLVFDLWLTKLKSEEMYCPFRILPVLTILRH